MKKKNRDSLLYSALRQLWLQPDMGKRQQLQRISEELVGGYKDMKRKATEKAIALHSVPV